MKLLVGLTLLLIVNGVCAQMDSTGVKSDSLVKAVIVNRSEFAGFDKVKLESGDSLIVNIIAETETEIAFKYPMNTMINKTPLVKIKEIIYKDGKVRSIENRPIITGVGAEQDNLWRIVDVTYDESEVAGLREIGPISARAEGKSLKTSIELLEKNVTVNLKKSALRMNATKVLVKKKNVEQSYGEIPLVELEGIAYGTK